MVETLTTLAVVMMLSVLLFSALEKSRTASYKAICASNMKTYYQAFIAYASDHNGKIVPYVDYKDSEDPQSNQLDIWQVILVRKGYLPKGRDPNTGAFANYVPHSLRCPANPAGYMSGERSPKGEEQFKYGTPNYLYNAASGSPVSFNGRDPEPVLRLPQVLSSRKALLFEGGVYKAWSHPYRCDYAANPAAIYFNPDHTNYKIGDVHNESSHVLFWDGHIETFKKGTIDWKIADWVNP